jgi:outer membrane lipoprotein-sorting protein
MKRLAAIVIAFLFASGLWAQNPQDDPKIMEAFKTTCSRLAEHPFIKGTFEQEKTLNRRGRSIKSSGAFIIASQQGMVWDTAKPFPSTLTLGKDYLIQSKQGGQKTLMSARGNETFIRMADVLSSVFTGNSQKLLDNFEVNYIGNSASWEIGLSPRDKAIGSFAEKIIMKGDAVIRSIQINEQTGDTIQYFLSNHSYPAELNVNEKAFFSLP